VSRRAGGDEGDPQPARDAAQRFQSLRRSRELIGNRHCNAEWALVLQMDYLVRNSTRWTTRTCASATDIVQVVERVLKAMLGTGHAPAPLARGRRHRDRARLSPADMILFKQHRYAGFVTDLGGVTSTPPSSRAASISRRSSACITRAA